MVPSRRRAGHPGTFEEIMAEPGRCVGFIGGTAGEARTPGVRLRRKQGVFVANVVVCVCWQAYVSSQLQLIAQHSHKAKVFL